MNTGSGYPPIVSPLRLMVRSGLVSGCLDWPPHLCILSCPAIARRQPKDRLRPILEPAAGGEQKAPHIECEKAGGQSWPIPELLSPTIVGRSVSGRLVVVMSNESSRAAGRKFLGSFLFQNDQRPLPIFRGGRH